MISNSPRLGRLLLPLARKLIREAVEIQQLTSSFQEQIVGHIRIACRESIVNTVEAGFGVSFVSRLAAAGALERRAVIEVLVAGFDLRRQIHMVRNTMHPANRAVEAFWGEQPTAAAISLTVRSPSTKAHTINTRWAFPKTPQIST